MNKLSPERAKIVSVACAVAGMSGVPVLLRSHPVLVALWIALMIAMLTYAIAGLIRLKRQGL